MMISSRAGMYWLRSSLLLMNSMDAFTRSYSFRGWNSASKYLNRFCISGWTYWMMLNFTYKGKTSSINSLTTEYRISVNVNRTASPYLTSDDIKHLNILTKSLMRVWRVGALFSIRRVASRLFFSMVASSVSNSWSIVFLDAGMGTARVAHRTRDAILLKTINILLFAIKVSPKI